MLKASALSPRMAQFLGREAASAGLVSTGTTRTDFPLERSYKRLGFREAVKKMDRSRRLKRMRDGVHMASKMLTESAAEEGRFYAALLTLTYAEGQTWKREQVARLLEIMRIWAKRRGFKLRYCWVAELQVKRMLLRGASPHQAIHYHIMLWLPAGTMIPKPDKAGWWPHGDTNIKQARSAVAYLMKYASKGVGDFDLPKGARLWGCGGLTWRDRGKKRYNLLPVYVKTKFDLEDEPQRLEGGGWFSPGSGEFLASVRIVFYDGAMWAIFPGEPPRRIEL